MGTSKRMVLVIPATAAVAVAGAWGAVAMASSGNPQKSHSVPKSHMAGHHCPNMGGVDKSTGGYSPADL